MTAQRALMLFLVGIPTLSIVLILFDWAFAPIRRRFVPRRYPARPSRRERRARNRSRSAPAPAPAPRTAAPETAPAPRRPARLVPVLVASVQPPRPVRAPWAPGDSLRRPIAGGAPPSPATMRKRAWSAYASIAPREMFGPVNVERMERGRPPLRFNPLTGALEAMDVTIDDVGHATLSWPDAPDAVDPFDPFAPVLVGASARGR